MSVVRQLLLISMVEAWRNRTIAGTHVYDSKIDTLDGFLKGQVRPIIIVSIEETEQDEDGPATAGLLGRPSRFTVMVQTAVASGQEIRDDAGTIVRGAIGESDASFEATLNVLDRQWRQVLTASDNEWAVLFRDLVHAVGVIRDTRATDPETGTKHAARFVQFKVDALPDPLPGDDIPPPIDAGLAAMEADGEDGYREIARIWRGMLTVGGDWPDWKRLKVALFTSNAGLAVLGQGPLVAETEVPIKVAKLNVSGVEPVEARDDP